MQRPDKLDKSDKRACLSNLSGRDLAGGGQNGHPPYKGVSLSAPVVRSPAEGFGPLAMMGVATCRPRKTVVVWIGAEPILLALVGLALLAELVLVRWLR